MFLGSEINDNHLDCRPIKNPCLNAIFRQKSKVVVTGASRSTMFEPWCTQARSNAVPAIRCYLVNSRCADRNGACSIVVPDRVQIPRDHCFWQSPVYTSNPIVARDLTLHRFAIFLQLGIALTVLPGKQLFQGIISVYVGRSNVRVVAAFKSLINLALRRLGAFYAHLQSD